MSNKYRLYYDATCPVCTNFIKLLRKKINISKISILPSPTDAKDFQFVDLQGRVYSGDSAVEQLSIAFPKIKNFFWMLPDKYKLKALKAAYQVGSAVRNILPRTTPRTPRHAGGCGCGKKS